MNYPPVDEEAAGRLSAMLTERHRPDEQAELAAVDEYRKQLRRTEHYVTPVVVLWDGSTSLKQAIDPFAHRTFDLDAQHDGRSWPWVQPQAGLLVWDPDHCGRVRDGEQLFGSVTWWIFWRDGYAPLGALDDNGDGVLSGTELAGISVWTDANHNGVSDPGEVVDAQRLGIRQISVRGEMTSDGVKGNPKGVQLQDGRFLATFDWTPMSDPEAPVSAR